MSAAPHEMVAPGVEESLGAAVPDRPAAPTLAQLLGHRTARGPVRPQSGVEPRPDAAFEPRPEPRFALQPHHQPQSPLLREPSFDELVHGQGRHRGGQEHAVPRSALHRFLLRARLVSTPARRPPARGAGPR